MMGIWPFNKTVTTDAHIEIDGITIEIRRKPIKNMHLRIYPPDGLVRVSAPLTLSMTHIRKQLETKRQWLHTQRARIQAQPVIPEPTMQTGEYHHFLGQAYPLIVIHSTQPTKIKLNDNSLILSAKPTATIAQKHAAFTAWYRQQMQAIVPSLIEKWQPVMGVSVAAWGAKKMKTRWGSCNTRTRHIWLNLVLMQKPIGCLEYVLVHEMVHLLEASHNARFYQLMDTFMPTWREYQKILRGASSLRTE